jgi:hypothetical protein
MSAALPMQNACASWIMMRELRPCHPLVRGLHDERRGRRSQPIDVRGDAGLVVHERGVDGDAVEDFAALAVDVQVDPAGRDRRRSFTKSWAVMPQPPIMSYR